MNFLELSVSMGKLRDEHRCTACCSQVLAFMLKSSVWLQIAPKSCYLCWYCANRLALNKLGRELTSDDLVPETKARCNKVFVLWLASRKGEP